MTNTLPIQPTNTSPRNFGIDLLRILCMIMIVNIHLLGEGGILWYTELLSTHYVLTWALECLCFCAVNCYALISGFVGYKQKVKFSNLLTLWLRVCFYSVLITIIFFIIHPETFNVSKLITSFFPVIFVKYWYFTAYFAIFLFMPLLNVAINNLNKKQLYAICAIMFLVFSFLATLFQRGNTFALAHGYSSFWLLVLYLFGGTMAKYGITSKLKKRWWLLIYIVCAGICLLSRILLPMYQPNFLGEKLSNSYLIHYTSPFIVLCAIALLGFFSNLKIKESSVLQKIISFFAPLCFSCYLIHNHSSFKEYLINNKSIALLNYNPYLMIAIIISMSLIIFIGTCLIDLIREGLFKLLKIKKLSKSIEKKTSVLLDKLFNNHTENE